MSFNPFCTAEEGEGEEISWRILAAWSAGSLYRLPGFGRGHRKMADGRGGDGLSGTLVAHVHRFRSTLQERGVAEPLNSITYGFHRMSPESN